MNAGIQKNLTGGRQPSHDPLNPPFDASQQPANWLASIPGGTMKLLEELRRPPRQIADLTQFLHSSERHFVTYAVMLLGTRRRSASHGAAERVHNTRFSGGAVHLPSIASVFGQ